jgi:parallel beta-helix repeat protein
MIKAVCLALMLPSVTLATSLQGDYNGDWRVDAGDYASARKTSASLPTWRANFGESAETVGVTIPLGTDIQAAINAHPAGTLFYVKAGERRLTTDLTPKSGDAFVAEPGAVLNGSRLLTSFTATSGKWYASGQTQQGNTYGSCLSTNSECGHPEDLFLDNKPLQHVASLANVAPGKWYFDYAADRIYMGDNPAGHKVETSVARGAFLGGTGISNVVIDGFTVEKFATESDYAAIDSREGSGWTATHNEARLNHAGGIQVTGGTISFNYAHNNGQQGIGSSGGVLTVENNELSNNNYAGYDYDWGGGGAKFTQMASLTVRNNYVHDNFGQGLWDDVSSNNLLYEGNTVVNNFGTGILHEIGGAATIRNNIVKNNATTHYNASDGQIIVYSSDHTQVYGNTVESNSPANTIVILEELRENTSHDDYVHHNSITLKGGASGNDNALAGAADFGDWSNSANNLFDYNTYYVPDPLAIHWEWPQNVTWLEFRLLGQEAHGQLILSSSGTGTTVSEPSTSLQLIVLIAVFLIAAEGPRYARPMRRV